jgi:hypothetical protein
MMQLNDIPTRRRSSVGYVADVVNATLPHKQSDAEIHPNPS